LAFWAIVVTALTLLAQGATALFTRRRTTA
jgi:hypothetical protein